MLGFSLNKLYSAIGISKQGVHALLKRQNQNNSMSLQVLLIVEQIRNDHPTMGIREMYFKINPQELGRDRFEALCTAQGLQVEKPKNYRKTTDSQGVKRFPNLLEGLEPSRMNQVWQSDITYFELGSKFCYITLIQDTYTKVIVGYNASRRLTTEQTTMVAIKMGISKYKINKRTALIIHSDGGGQYYANDFLALTQKHGIENSMGKSCYENAMAESLNGVIKNKYLKHMGIQTFQQLQQALDRVVELYNTDKPHSSLNRLTPKQFETNCISLSSQTNATMNKSIDAMICKTEAPSHCLTSQTNAQNQISSLQ